MTSKFFKLCIFLIVSTPLSIWGQINSYPSTGNAQINDVTIGASGPAYGVDLKLSTYGGWARQFIVRNVYNNQAGKGYFGVYGGASTTSYAYIGLQNSVSPTATDEYSYANNIKFYSNGNMSIPSSLGIGLGTITPTKRLDLANTQGNGIQMRFDGSLSYTAGITPYWTSGADTRMDFAIGYGAAPAPIMTLRAQNGTISTARMEIAGKIVAGSLGSTYGEVLLEGLYSNGSLFNMGTMYSSGNPYWGYGIKTKSGTNGYLSSTNIPAGRAGIELSGSSEIKFLIGDTQSSTDGGIVSLNQAATLTQTGLGIGTSTPTTKLDIIGTYSSPQFHNGYTPNNGIFMHAQGGPTHTNWVIGQQRTVSGLEFTPSTTAGGALFSNPAMVILADGNINFGNVGIGTTAPRSNLEVIQNGYQPGITVRGAVTASHPQIRVDGNSSTMAAMKMQSITGATFGYMGTENQTDLRFITNNTAQVAITTSGSVGIGTMTPPVGYKLAIAGDVIATKVVVKALVNWPDYVFKPDYNLPPLSTIEQHIKEKGHLPNIPTEKEVAEKGIDLGDMHAKLLQKVEELTLYLIKQEKRLEEQQREIDALKKAIKQ
jgi:hypothetical protein